MTDASEQVAEASFYFLSLTLIPYLGYQNECNF